MVLSADNTHLVNTITHKPVFITGEAAWCLATQISDADVETYLADRHLRGFNLIWIAAADNAYQSDPPKNFYGYSPFDGADFTNEDATYWAHLDHVIQRAQADGITVAIDPGFVGLTGTGGYIDSYIGSSDAVVNAYGQWIGNRYKSYSNIIWAIGGDANYKIGGLYAKLNDLASGIEVADPNHLMTAELCPEGVCGFGHSSTQDGWIPLNVGSTPILLDLNWIYNQHPSVQPGCVTNYIRSGAWPQVVGETWYENEHSLTALQVREEGYWGALSGCTLGYIFGNNPIWCFNSTRSAPSCNTGTTWKSELSSNGSVTQQWMGALMRSREFWKLVPDSSNAVLTGGIGSGTSKSVCSCTSDGYTCIVYDPIGNRQAPQIAMSHFTGTVHAWWFNPTNGTTTDLNTFTNSGTQAFTPADGEDWVLVLDLNSANLPAPGSVAL
jgi:hypothetical protein